MQPHGLTTAHTTNNRAVARLEPPQEVGGIITRKSASVPECTTIRLFEADVVIDGVAEPLFAAKVTRGGLHAHLTKKKLDLLQLPAGFVAQTGAGSAKIVRSNTIQTALGARRSHNAPYHLRTEDTLPSLSHPC